MGGGAIAGLSMAGRELASVTGDMVQYKNALRDGTMSQGEFTEKIMGSLPVLGAYWQAGRNIREMFTGEEAEIAKATKAFDKHLTKMKEINAALENFKKVNATIGGSLGDMKFHDVRELQMMQTPEPFKAGLQAQFELEDKALRVKEALKAEAKSDPAKPKRPRLGGRITSCKSFKTSMTRLPSNMRQWQQVPVGWVA